MIINEKTTLRDGVPARRSRSSGFASMGLALVLAVVASACAGDASATSSGSTDTTAGTVTASTATTDGTATTQAPEQGLEGVVRAPEPDPTRGGTLRVTGGATTTNFDLYQGAATPVLMNLYNSLVRKNPADGLREVYPDLAVSWDVSDDGLRYTFHLREGVEFHDGTPFTSADVVATFSRAISPPEGVTILQQASLSMVEEVTATDDFTVDFILSSPAPYFLEMLTGGPNARNAYPIYSKKALDENAGDLRSVIAPGTGPFIFGEHRVEEFWVFERNPNYWDPELPYLDAIQIIHTPDLADRGTAILTGDADLTMNTSIEVLAEAESRGGFTTALVPSLSAHTAHFNTEREPFNDPRVRRAIFLALNHQGMISLIGQRESASMGRWMPPASPWSTPAEEIETLPGYRPDKEADIAEARRLMAEAGYADGFGPIDLATSQVSEVITAGLESELRQVLNITSNIRTVERASLGAEYQAGSFDMIVETQFSSTQLDPTPLWEATLATGAPLNWARYSNPDFDALLSQIREETDEEARMALFMEGADILDEDVPLLVLGFTSVATLASEDVKGLNLTERVHNLWAPLDTAWLDR